MGTKHACSEDYLTDTCAALVDTCAVLADTARHAY
jgi:hypothetical protein